MPNHFLRVIFLGKVTKLSVTFTFVEDAVPNGERGEFFTFPEQKQSYPAEEVMLGVDLEAAEVIVQSEVEVAQQSAVNVKQFPRNGVVVHVLQHFPLATTASKPCFPAQRSP